MIKNKKNILIFLTSIILLLVIFFAVKEYRISKISVYLHNQWNIAMQEYFSGGMENIYLAENLYSGSLLIMEHPDTRYNYNQVLDILSENKSEEKKQEQSEEVGDAGMRSEEKDEESQTEQWEEKKQEQSEEVGDAGMHSNEELSQKEKQQLEEITQQIKSQQNYNQQYYNKQPQESSFDDLFEDFLWEVNRGWEKDW